MTEARIQKLKQIIAERVPQDYLILKPGEHHIYHAPDTGADYISVTTRLHVISNPIFQNWRMNRALEYLYDHFDEIDGNSKNEVFKAAKEYPEEEFKKAGEIGTKIHGYAEIYFKDWLAQGVRPPDILYLLDGRRGSPKEEDWRCWSALRSLEKWVIKSGFVPLASELQVWSNKKQVAGTLDLVGVIGNDIVIVDLKTSNDFRDDYHLQVGCYWGCFRELTKIRPNYCIILKLDKEQAEEKTELIPNPDKRFKNFMVASELYDIMQEIRGFRKANNGRKVVTI